MVLGYPPETYPLLFDHTLLSALINYGGLHVSCDVVAVFCHQSDDTGHMMTQTITLLLRLTDTTQCYVINMGEDYLVGVQESTTGEYIGMGYTCASKMLAMGKAANLLAGDPLKFLTDWTL